MKKIFMLFSIVLFSLGLVACKKEKSEVEKIIEEAQNMTLTELMAKAYEESKNMTLYGLGNSSRGKTAGETFVAKMKETYPDYNGVIEWSQPKDNSIFDMLTQDTNGANPKFFMTLIQDGSQIQSKMIDTGILLNFIPKEFAAAQGVDVKANGNPLALQTLSKVFMFNHGNEEYNFSNVWHFVKEGQKNMMMGLNSEPVGFNFLLMLTNDEYVKVVKEAFDALTATEKAYFQPKVDALKAKAQELGLGANAEYSLAWINEWVKAMNVKTDDGPISNDLVKSSASGQTALIVYSKLRSIEESAEASVNNIKVAAYEEGYVGFGGFAYKHYLQILKKSPAPWTAAAFIAYMVTDATGFNPWGKDIGGYSPNPGINQDHSQAGWVDGVNQFPAKNDRGADWWLTNASGKGRLVIEDPVYASSVAFTVGEWIESLSH